MRILIQTLPFEAQEYPTAGNWLLNRDKTFLVIQVSKLGGENREFLVALHEFIEAMLCYLRNISPGAVDAWDNTHPTTPDYEPGDDPQAPYYREHQFATAIERLVCHELNIDWNDYEKEIGELFKDSSRES